MPLPVGSKLGSYEITGTLGAGGMGEVYRARDAKLNRDVAIKVLPETLARDAAALSRFEREAQAVAALSHPNILAIYDFGSTDGITFAVTELLEGETLRSRLSSGALPVRKALDYGAHIVHGIAAAHERGIIHRDLKPENVFITKDGVVKILDFGLAKTALSTATAAETTLQADTSPGTVLGTVGYMSPEQVRGLTVDPRSDIFSIGAVLYEMLTGRRAFRGDSQVETMNAILKEDPPEFAEINPTLPASLDRIVRRCLEKAPADRFHSAHDLGIALEALSGASAPSSSSQVAVVPAASTRRLGPWIAAAAAVAIAAVGAFIAGRAFSAPPAASPPEFQRLTYRRGQIWSAKLARDGATIVYSAAWDGGDTQMFSTRAETTESLLMPLAKTTVVAISSKDELALISDRRVVRAYAQPGLLSRATISGGAARAVLEDVQDADWLPDGSNLVVSHFVNGRYRLEFPIGTVVYETGGWISHPRVSPDGRRVAFLDHPLFGDDRGFVAVIDAAGKKATLSPENESTQGLAWTPSGNEIWYTATIRGSGRSLEATTVDGQTRSVLRTPSTLTLDDIGRDGTVLLTNESHRRGIAGIAPGDPKERDLSWLEWTQANQLSDDGKTLLITEEAEGGGPGYSLFLRKTDGSPAVRLGSGEGMAMSPDGKWVIAQRLKPEPTQLVLMPTGAGEARPLTNDDIMHLTAQFTPDGKQFVFVGFAPNKHQQAFIQDVAGGAAKALTPEGIATAMVVPDGKRIEVRLGDGTRQFYPIDGSAPTPVPFLTQDEGLIRFTADSRAAFVARKTADGVFVVSRVDLTTGARTPVRQVAPPPAYSTATPLLSADGSIYAYGYGVTQADLYLVKGLR